MIEKLKAHLKEEIEKARDSLPSSGRPAHGEYETLGRIDALEGISVWICDEEYTEDWDTFEALALKRDWRYDERY